MRIIFLAAAWLALACDAGAQQEIAVSVVSSSVRYSPGKWGLVSATVANRREQPVEVDVVVSFVDDPDHEFSRRVWLPARSQRKTWVAVLTPQKPAADSLSDRTGGSTAQRRPPLRLTTRLAEADGTLQRSRETLGLFSEALLSQMAQRRPTGVIAGGDPAQRDRVNDFVELVRRCANLPYPGASLYEREMPAWPLWLDALDMVVLADDAVLADDPGCLEALSRWVREGGRLWIMMDDVPPETVQKLIGDALDLTFSGREMLTEVAVQTSASPAPAKARPLDDPAPLWLLHGTSGEVICEVNGWPAAVVGNVGAGEVLISTMARHGWLISDPRSMQETASPELNFLAARLLAEPATLELPRASARSQLNERIGYQAPSRGIVLGVLGGLFLTLLAAGLVLVQRRRLEHLVWVAPLLSLAAVAALLAIGGSFRRDSTLTVARIQWVHHAGGAGQTLTSEAAMYCPTTLKQQLGGARALAHSSQAGPLRVVWTDQEQWRWEGPDLRPGTVAISQRGAGRGTSMRAVASCSQRGLEGVLYGGPERPQQAILVAPRAPSIALQWDLPGKFLAAPDQTLALGRHLPDKLLDDEGRRRQSLLKQLLAENLSLAGPHLFFWTHPVDDGIDWPADAEHVGSALVSVPLTLRPAAPGQPVMIPGSLLTFETQSSMYDQRRGQWQGELNREGQLRLDFKIPASLLPVEVTRTVLELRMDAPGREVRLSSASGQLLRSLDRLMGLSLIEFTSEELAADADGRLRLVMDVAESPASSPPNWSIRQLLLHVHGVQR